MAAQSLIVLKGSGAFIRAGTHLTNDSSFGSPYPTAAGSLDFTAHPTWQDLLARTNHATTPQHDTTHPSVAFLYSTWT